MDIKELTERYQDRFDAHYLRSNGILSNKRSMRKGFKMRDYSLFIFLNL
ncbi:Uncharacterised protein [Bacteroides uniformis]|uniref:Uncharacterized protein n=1 Tax=Bacteroides uniformis TaxID=820 RepID=A0A6N2R5Q9_BACUN